MIQNLLKTMLLLCTLIVGNGTVWAKDGDAHDFTQAIDNGVMPI